MQYSVQVKALHPIKGWVKFSFEVEAKNPEDAVIQAKKQPRVKDYSVFNVLSTASAVDQHPVPTEESKTEKTKSETSNVAVIQPKPPEPTSEPIQASSVKEGF